MDALNMVVKVPSWAYDFCYYYLAMAALVAIYAIWALYKLFTLPGIVKRFVPMTTMTIALIISSALSIVLTMMQFWVCRSALKPSTEKFAAKCANEADCTAITGTPQPSTCACGGRGLCGGCVMQNNMEPQMYVEGGDVAPFMEGFQAPPRPMAFANKRSARY
jgi:hypothetical protein